MSILAFLKYIFVDKLLHALYGGLGVENFITLMAGIAAFVSVYAVWHGAVAKNPLGSRARNLRRHRERLRAGLLAPTRSRHRQRRVDALSLMRRATHRLNLVRSNQAQRMTGRLAQAGWRSKDALVVFLFMKVALPFAFGAAAAAGLYGSGLDMPPMVKLLVAMVFVVLGAYAPEIFVRNAIQKRRKALQKGLPDALDLLVICAEAGLAIDAALTRVAREMERSSPEVADEFGLTAVELGMLPQRRQALDNLDRRTDMPSVRGVVNTLVQTERYGTPLAQALRVLSSEYRDERMLKAEEKAAKLPATLTIPLVVFILPTLFVVLLSPAVLQALDSFASM